MCSVATKTSRSKTGPENRSENVSGLLRARLIVYKDYTNICRSLAVYLNLTTHNLHKFNT